MYFASVLALMLVFPLLSIGIQMLLGGPGTLTAFLTAKWFVFWMVGVRLLLAGVRQIVQPGYTAEQILGVKDPDAALIVRELGIANTAVGCIGVAGLFFRHWAFPIGLIGAIFYALAGINHAADKHRTKLQNVAMFSDLYAAVVLVILCGAFAQDLL